ncbi:MAG: hypothetical protein Q9191_007671 [Dirinaria sp. TL-2023a]
MDSSKHSRENSLEHTNVSIPDESTPLLRPDEAVEREQGTICHASIGDKVQNGAGGTDEESSTISQKTSSGVDAKLENGILGIISVLLLGCFIANADGSIIMATYGTIASEIDRLDNGSWLVVTYGLASCAIQPTYGKLSDLYGRKAMLIFFYTLFTLGCALCGAALNLWQMLLGRALGGLAAAGMTSLVSVLIADTVPLRDVATWRSYVNIASTVGRSAGGPIGGYLADTIGWRWSFYIQCPLAIIAIFLVSWKVPGRVPHARGSEESKGKLRRIDFLGSISLAVAIVGFLLVLDLGGQRLSWKHPLIWIIFAVAAVFSSIFILVEAFVVREPIFPLRLLFHRDVMTTYSITALQGTAQFAILTLAGTLSSVLCYALLIVFWKGNTSVWESLLIGPGGFGTGIVLATTFVAIAAGVDESQMAIASTGLYLSGNMGMLIGASLASNILLSTLRLGLEAELKGFPDRDIVRGNLQHEIAMNS